MWRFWKLHPFWVCVQMHFWPNGIQCMDGEVHELVYLTLLQIMCKEFAMNCLFLELVFFFLKKKNIYITVPGLDLRNHSQKIICHFSSWFPFLECVSIDFFFNLKFLLFPLVRSGFNLFCKKYICIKRKWLSCNYKPSKC